MKSSHTIFDPLQKMDRDPNGSKKLRNFLQTYVTGSAAKSSSKQQAIDELMIDNNCKPQDQQRDSSAIDDDNEVCPCRVLLVVVLGRDIPSSTVCG